MRDDSPLNNGPKKLGAFFESKGFEAAADGIKEDITCSFILLKAESQWRTQSGIMAKLFTYGKIRVNFVIVYVARHVLDFWIEFPDAGYCGGIGPQSGHC